jgi:hypothetical protein
MPSLKDSQTARGFVILFSILVLLSAGWCGARHCSSAPEVAAAQSPEALAQVLIGSFQHEEPVGYIDHALRIRDLSWIQAERKKAGQNPRGFKFPGGNVVQLRKNMVKSWRKAKADGKDAGIPLEASELIEIKIAEEQVGPIQAARLELILGHGENKGRLVIAPIIKTGRGWIFAAPVHFRPR